MTCCILIKVTTYELKMTLKSNIPQNIFTFWREKKKKVCGSTYSIEHLLLEDLNQKQLSSEGLAWIFKVRLIQTISDPLSVCYSVKLSVSLVASKTV